MWMKYVANEALMTKLCVYNVYNVCHGVCIIRCQHSRPHAVWWHSVDIRMWEWTHRRGWSSARAWCWVGKLGYLLKRLEWTHIADTEWTTLCLKKFRTPVIFSNNSNKSGPILITFDRENCQWMVSLQVYYCFLRLIKQDTSLGCFCGKISNHCNRRL